MGWETASPAVVAAVVSGAVAVVGVILNLLTTIFLHTRRLGADRDLAERKVNADMALAERKFQLDATLADRKRRQDLAEEVLSGFYQMRGVMRTIRSVGSFGGEAKGRPKAEDETEKVSRARDVYYVAIARLDAHRRPIADLLALQYRMAAWFGKEAEKPFQQLNEVVNQVWSSAEHLIAWAGKNMEQTNADLWRKMEEDIWSAAEPDLVKQKLEAAIAEIEAICRPALEGPSLPGLANPRALTPARSAP